MQYPNGTTFVVTDGSTLRLFRNSGDELQLKLEELAAPHLHAHHGAGHGPHGTEGNSTPRQATEGSHAAATVAWLNQEVLAGRIGPLYIVAPPRTLGELRPHYHAVLKSRLLGEMAKEHTHDPLNKLRDVLAADKK